MATRGCHTFRVPRAAAEWPAVAAPPPAPLAQQASSAKWPHSSSPGRQPSACRRRLANGGLLGRNDDCSNWAMPPLATPRRGRHWRPSAASSEPFRDPFRPKVSGVTSAIQARGARATAHPRGHLGGRHPRRQPNGKFMLTSRGEDFQTAQSEIETVLQELSYFARPNAQLYNEIINRMQKSNEICFQILSPWCNRTEPKP